MSTIQIRQEEERDYPAVKALIQAAFAAEPYSDQKEHLLVERLRRGLTFVPELSLVAEEAGKIVGHILLSLVAINDGTSEFPALALAPVSVHPEWQRRGIGGQLIEAAHQKARAMGYKAVILLGHADYYPRFGYQQLGDYGITLPFEAPPENCMVLELEAGALRGVSGQVVYPPAFME